VLNVEIKSIILSTSQAFFEVLLSGEKLKIAENNLQEHSKLVKIIQRRFHAKTSPEVDVMLASARLAQAKSQVSQTKVGQETAWTKLTQLIGVRPHALLVPETQETLSVLGEFALKDLKVMTQDYSPDIRALSADVKKNQASVKVAKSVARPKISLGYEKRYGELLLGQEQEQMFLGIDFQPGAGLSSRRQLSAAKMRVDSSRSNLRALSLETNQAVEILYQQHLSSKSQIETTRVLVEAMSKVVASYLRQYTVGRKSWLDVLNSQRELFQAENALVDFRLQNVVTGYKLLAEAGILQSAHLVKSSNGDLKSNE
jgi:adhesin transport system outer membrane protein